MGPPLPGGPPRRRVALRCGLLQGVQRSLRASRRRHLPAAGGHRAVRGRPAQRRSGGALRRRGVHPRAGDDRSGSRLRRRRKGSGHRDGSRPAARALDGRSSRHDQRRRRGHRRERTHRAAGVAAKSRPGTLCGQAPGPKPRRARGPPGGARGGCPAIFDAAMNTPMTPIRYAAAACQTDLPNPASRSDMAAGTTRMLSMIDSAVAGSAPFLPVRLVVFPEFAHAAPVYASVADLARHLAVPIPNEHTELLAGKAREYDIYIQSGSMIEIDPRWPGALFNTTCLIGPEGLLYKYRK